jgi:hypothetical protein
LIKIRERRPSRQPTSVQPYVSREAPKRWTADDTATLEAACATGRLPDGRIATQIRLALYLGFHRNTIVGKLAGRRLPLCNALMSEGGIRSARQRAMARMNAIRASIKSRNSV